MNNLQEFFLELGFSQKDYKIYMYLLTSGSQVASTIAKKIGVGRVGMYATLKALIRKGLIVDYTKNKLTYFKAIEPEDIISLCEKKEVEYKKLTKKSESISKVLENLQKQNISGKKSISDGEISYYEGIDAVDNLIQETLEVDDDIQLCFGINGYHIDNHSDTWPEYTQSRVKKGIFVKSIQPDIVEALNYASRDNDELRETRLVPHKEFPAFSELNIMGDEIAIFTTNGKRPEGMKITNKYMAETLKSLFNIAWKKLK